MLSADPLSPHALAVLLLAGGALVLFVWDRWPIAQVSLGLLTTLALGFAVFPMAQPGGGVLDAHHFFAGFGHPALVAICALMVLGAGIEKSGALEPLARRMAGLVGERPRWALLLVLASAALASALVNDTPVVVLLIPMLLAATRRAGVPAGGFLLPMNYAVLIGGMATAIGTSTNLIVVQLAQQMGAARFGLFDWVPLVALAALPAFAYLALVAPRLLRHVQAERPQPQGALFDAELNLLAGNPLIGQPLTAVLQRGGAGMQLLRMDRGGLELARLPSLILREGDRLLLRASATLLREAEERFHAPLHDLRQTPAEHAEMVQFLIGARSPLLGLSVRQARLAERFGLVALGVHPLRVPIGQRGVTPFDHPLREGDVLLVQGPPAAVREARAASLGLLLDEHIALPRRHHARTAMLVMAAVVLVAALKLLPIALAALAGALALVLFRCLTLQEAAQSLSVKVVLLVTASLALGDALMVTGATDWLAARLVLALQGLSVAWIVAILMGAMGLLTNFVSNNAAAAVGTPLAVAMATALGAPAEPFVLAVLFGCNLCYLTPFGYQTNLLTLQAGGYRFADFARVGTPLFVIMWLGLSLGLAWRYGL